MPPKKKAAASSRSSRSRGTGRGSSEAVPPASAYGEPELIVVAEPEAGLRIGREGVASLGGADVRGLDAVAAREGVVIRPLHGPEDRVRRRASEAAATAVTDVPDLSVYYRVEAPVDRLGELAEELLESDGVAGAYVKPPGEPPQLNDMQPAAEDAPPATPDFEASQIYLDPAPAGIDAGYAWTWPGGGGAGVRVIDCEWGWRFDHEDLTTNQGGVVVGTGGTDTNHGTAVIGEISGDRNGFGVTGICPDAIISAAAFGASAPTIRAAADRLGAGDIILLEIHRAGPRNNFQGRQDQHGYIAIEWWPDDFDAILYATSRGIIVVEAAGNGSQDLDDSLYSVRPPGFPVTWTNPYNRANRDCGAVVVGAGAPPPGTHGRNHGADRSRLDFSNFGALVDAQGWGREVTSTGYGNLQGGGDARFWYTETFSGTSSASPIVVGALGCLQGALRAAGKPTMTPANARAWLRSSGSPQQDEPGRPATQRIGNRPNLRQLFQAHVKAQFLVDKGAVKEQKLEKIETKERKDAVKEKIEAKELKREKIEKVEIKEGKREKVEIKEIREKDQIKERKELVEGIDVKGGAREVDLGRIQDVIRPGGGGPQAGEDLDARLAALESSVAALVHFIGADLRPDLGGGALTREPDMSDQAQVAKDQKDMKDKENLADG
jgi:hypothetical protein